MTYTGKGGRRRNDDREGLKTVRNRGYGVGRHVGSAFRYPATPGGENEILLSNAKCNDVHTRDVYEPFGPGSSRLDGQPL